VDAGGGWIAATCGPGEPSPVTGAHAVIAASTQQIIPGSVQR
jgi:hypothetical protein